MDMHFLPAVQVIPQSEHIPPPLPHMGFVVPGWHMVPSQHPPLQFVLVTPQAVEHTPAVQA
jgi:hypothetical protein